LWPAPAGRPPVVVVVVVGGGPGFFMLFTASKALGVEFCRLWRRRRWAIVGSGGRTPAWWRSVGGLEESIFGGFLNRRGSLEFGRVDGREEILSSVVLLLSVDPRLVPVRYMQGSLFEGEKNKGGP